VNVNAPASGPRRWARAAVVLRRLKETRKGRQNSACVSVKATTLARKASKPGSMAGITSGGGAVRTTCSPSARRPGHPQRGGGRLFSPRWPRAVVQASVKKGGATCRRGGRRRRRGDVEA
jgi:hypothetical protein